MAETIFELAATEFLFNLNTIQGFTVSTLPKYFRFLRAGSRNADIAEPSKRLKRV